MRNCESSISNNRSITEAKHASRGENYSQKGKINEILMKINKKKRKNKKNEKLKEIPLNIM